MPRQPGSAPRSEWLSGTFPGEQADAEHVLVYGDEAPFTVLTDQPPEPGEGGPGWHADETDRFGLLARRLWDRLLDAESASDVTATVAFPTAFDLLGPLPEGTTVLEASAGTGKTFTIAALVARYVAEGVATMDELLVVSFSRESTRELRERVRERLVERARRAGRPGAVLRRTIELLVHLADADAAEIAVRRRRLEEALAVFDAATVTTTHGFCQQVLLALGTAGDYDTGAALIENIGDLVTEVADDLYVRKWGAPNADKPTMSREDFHQLAMARRQGPGHRPACPTTRPPTACPACARASPTAVRAEVDVRKRRQQLIDYDDMLIRLSHHADRPRLRGRWRAAGCATATGSCSSTSSRTPTRCSGASCARRSTGTARSC